MPNPTSPGWYKVRVSNGPVEIVRVGKYWRQSGALSIEFIGQDCRGETVTCHEHRLTWGDKIAELDGLTWEETS